MYTCTLLLDDILYSDISTAYEMFSLLFITAILSCDTSCVDMEKLKNIYDNVSSLISEFLLPVQFCSDCCAFCEMTKVKIKMFIFQF